MSYHSSRTTTVNARKLGSRAFVWLSTWQWLHSCSAKIKIRREHGLESWIFFLIKFTVDEVLRTLAIEYIIMVLNEVTLTGRFCC